MLFSNPNMPCKGCVPPKRYGGCHDHCEEYKAVCAEMQKIKDRVNQAKEIERLHAEGARRGISIRNKFKDKSGGK